MNEFSMDDLKAVLGDLPGEPPQTNRAAAVRRRARIIRQRRTAASAVAVGLPVVGLGLFRGDPGQRPVEVVAGPEVSAASTVSGPAAPDPVVTSSAPARTLAAAPRTAKATVAPSRKATVAATQSVQPKPSTSTVAKPPAKPTAKPTGKPTANPQPTKVDRPGPGLVVRMSATDSQVETGEPVDFDVAWSDTDGIYVGYELDYGDIGASKYGRPACTGGVRARSGSIALSHSWSVPGTYEVTYSVRTCNGAGDVENSTASVVVTVVAPEPEPEPDPTPTPTPTPSPDATTDPQTEPTAGATPSATS